MKRENLEKFLNKKVEIVLCTEDIVQGELHKTRDEQFKDNPNLYLPKNFYFCTEPQSYLFRTSHVKYITLLK